MAGPSTSFGWGRFAEVQGTYRDRPAADVVREYLAEVAKLVAESDAFSVLAHIDSPDGVGLLDVARVRSAPSW